MPIRVLDPKVASKIAAGEVVERPASVVKELLENAIDAGATVIYVEMRNGGLDLIRVVDNGCGIPHAEMELAFQHHATSKISSLDDLQTVHTLGFRGEALYSIAAVAQVSLFSRTADDAGGSFLEIADGQITDRGARGAPQGTTVTVRNIFYNIPARRKFLKSADVEGGRITVLVNQLALAYPALHFYLIHNGRQVFQSTGSGSLYDALVKVFGLETARQMIEVTSSKFQVPSPQSADHTGDLRPGTCTVSGYVSQPYLTRANRTYLSFFVNHRWVQSPLLGRAVEDAYHTMLQVGRHPIAVLNVALPPEELDVNVHPAKSEVKFLREGEVFTAVQKAVRAALTQHAAIPEFAPSPVSGPQSAIQGPLSHLFIPPASVPAASSHAALDLYRPPEPGTGTLERETWNVEPGTQKLPPLRIVGQMAQTYIIAEAPDGLYLIDQHTAHERILYERLMAEQARLAVKSQMLLDPMPLDLTPRQQAMLKPRLEALAQIGFQIDPFGERAYLLRAIPAVLQGADATQAILEIIDLLADEKAAPGNWQEGLCITLACHGGVRAGQTLTAEEMRQLVVQLEQTTLPRTCPHGRPTLLHITQTQLEKEFGRR